MAKIKQPYGLAWAVAALFVIVLVSAFFVGYLAGRNEGNGGSGDSQGIAMKGIANAPVTLVEWSDFQCPYSGRFSTQTLPQVITEYINTGKIKIIFKDYPLPASMHPMAEKAAEAGKCALEQSTDKFWALHDKMFASQSQLSVDNLKLWAAQLGIDVAKFNACLDSGRMAAVVATEQAEGAAKGIQGTPGFVIISASGKETTISGAQPFTAFQTAIDAALAGN